MSYQLQNSMHLSLHWSQLVDKRKQTTVFLECLLQSQSQQLSGIDRALLWTWIVLIWEQVKKCQCFAKIEPGLIFLVIYFLMYACHAE